MGWRQFVRSAQASARRAQRVQDQQRRASQRARDLAERHIDRLEAEIYSDAKKVERYEDSIRKRPIAALDLELHQDGSWSARELVDNTGKLTFSISPQIESIAATVSPKEAVVGGLRIEVRACAITQYATYICVSVHSFRPERASFVNRSTPENSRVAIVDSEGEVYWPLDGSVDGQLPANAKRSGIIAFEPFTSEVEHFTLAFTPRQREDEDSAEVRIEFSGTDVKTRTAAMVSPKSLVDSFLESALAEHSTARSSLRRAARPASKQAGGCAMLLAAVLGLFATAIAMALA